MRTTLQVETLEAREQPAAAFQALPVMPFSDPAVLDHARAIFVRGQQLGRQLDVVMKAGDSNSTTYPDGPRTLTPFLDPLGQVSYQPGATDLAAAHPELLDTWRAYFWSFARVSTAAHLGWRSVDVWSAVGSEVAAGNAAVALVMVGTNDAGTGVGGNEFRSNLTAIVETLARLGVVPVLSTLPDMSLLAGQFESRVVAFNQIIADVAGEFRVPLWNLWRATTALPDFGLNSGGVHLSVSPDGAGSFYPTDLAYGQNVRNLEALQILDWFRETVATGPTYVAPNATWQPMADTRALYAVGRDTGFSPTVDVYDATTGERVNRFLAFEASDGGGVRVATGDVNGDGYTDVVCTTAAGPVGRVRVFSGRDGSVLTTLKPFGAGYAGGLSIAVGDLDGDGAAEIVAGKLGQRSGVRVYRGGDFAQLAAFRAFPGMAGGVSVAVANVQSLGTVIVVGSATNPVVRYFDCAGPLVASFHVPNGSGSGISVAAADLTGDGFDELAVSALAGSRHVAVLDGSTHAALATFAVGPVADDAYGIRLGTLRAPSGTDTLLVGNGPGSALSLRGFDDLGGTAIRLAPTNARRAYGIFAG